MTSTRPAPGSRGGLADRLRRQQDRLEATTVGHVQRRVIEVQLTRQALLVAAYGLMLVVPALVTLAAVVPLGRPDGAVGAFAGRAGLSPEATHDLQQLFPTTATVSGATTAVGALLTVILTVRWPMALQRALELVWDLPRGGLRSSWRALVWLGGFLALVAAGVLVGPIFHGAARLVAILLVGFPVAVAWAWWTQHLLLGGRIAWRPLLPGALVTGVGLVGLRLFAAVALSPVITTHYREYGPLGIVFVILSSFVAFGVVVLGGALVGHVVAARSADVTPPG